MGFCSDLLRHFVSSLRAVKEEGCDIKKTCVIYCNFCSLDSTNKQDWKAPAIKEEADTGIDRAQEDKKPFKRPQSQGMWSGKLYRKKSTKFNGTKIYNLFRSQELSDKNTYNHVFKYIQKCVINNFKTFSSHVMHQKSWDPLLMLMHNILWSARVNAICCKSFLPVTFIRSW